jgi:hypothetical protein
MYTHFAYYLKSQSPWIKTLLAYLKLMEYKQKSLQVSPWPCKSPTGSLPCPLGSLRSLRLLQYSGVRAIRNSSLLFLEAVTRQWPSGRSLVLVCMGQSGPDRHRYTAGRTRRGGLCRHACPPSLLLTEELGFTVPGTALSTQFRRL